jgi:hypothetical protein
LGSEPSVESTKFSAGEPSPHVTLTCHGPLSFPSLKEPRAKLLFSPSSENWLGPAVTIGGAFGVVVVVGGQ